MGTLDLYKAFSDVTSSSAAPFLMRMVNEDDAKRAYEALLDFRKVVKANPISPVAVETPRNLIDLGSQLDAPAEKLAGSALAFVRDFDWTSDLPLRPLPDLTSYDIMKGIDSMLVMGASMDGKLLQQAAEAHHQALGNLPPSLVVAGTAESYHWWHRQGHLVRTN